MPASAVLLVRQRSGEVLMFSADESRPPVSEACGIVFSSDSRETSDWGFRLGPYAGAGDGIRTHSLLITNQLLCR